ncbi:MAG: sterol desaturase family protein [Myxococcota bacterium]
MATAFPLVASVHLKAWTIALSWLGGFVVWTLFEYGFHRFVLHTAVGRAFRAWDDHGFHHHHPEDPQDFVYTLLESGLLAAAVAGVSLLLGGLAGAVGLSGFLVGYLCYECVHMAAHWHAFRSRRSWLKRRSNHHLDHHIHHPTANFGFVTSLWDRVLRTRRACGRTQPAEQLEDRKASAGARSAR